MIDFSLSLPLLGAFVIVMFVPIILATLASKVGNYAIFPNQRLALSRDSSIASDLTVVIY
jgi:hypothetical protein